MPSGYFSTKRDTEIVAAGGFWCFACLVGKPAVERSPDPRYCQSCYEFLSKEAETLKAGGQRVGDWKPKTPVGDAPQTACEALPVSESVVSKIAYEENHTIGIMKRSQDRRGRHRKQGEISRVTRWRRDKQGQGVLL